jgi:hypothetical protein
MGATQVLGAVLAGAGAGTLGYVASAGREPRTRVLIAGGAGALTSLVALLLSDDEHRAGPPPDDALRKTLEGVPSDPPPRIDLPPPGVKSHSYPGPAFPAAPPTTWVQVQQSPGLVVSRPSRSWATEETAHSLQKAAHFWGSRRDHYGLGDYSLKLWDVSKQGGGPLPPHKSHQHGRDADLVITNGKKSGLPAAALPLMLQALLDDDNLEGIFLDWNMQKAAWDEATATSPDFGNILPELQYPLPKHTGRTRVRHWPGHADHLHVRYRR